MTKFYSRYKALLFSLILLIGTIGAGYGFARIYYPAVASIGTGDITGTMILDRTITGADISTSTALTIDGLTVTNATATDLTVSGGNITTSKLTVSGTSTLATTTITNLASATGNVSMFTNDAGYLTSYTETDPVWAATSSNYLTTANAAATYLPLTGGTISGTLDINGTSTLATTTVTDLTVSGTATIAYLKAPYSSQGTIFYVNSAQYLAPLPPGTSGQYLKTQGSGADPVWGPSPKAEYIKGSASGTDYQGTATTAEDVDATNLSKDLSDLTVGGIIQITYDYKFRRYLDNLDVYTRIQDITNGITLAQFTANAGGWFHEKGIINYIVPSTSLTIRLQAWISGENEDWVVSNGSESGSGVTPVITFQKL